MSIDLDMVEIRKNLILTLCSILFSLFLGEIIVRILVNDKHPEVIRRGREQVMNPLPGIRYLYDAGSSHMEIWPSDPANYFDRPGNSLTYVTNNYGFRDDDFTLRLGSRFRIAILGDSFCWGSGVKRKDRFSNLLEKKLNDSSLAGLQYEVFNFALPGLNTENEASLYEYVVDKFCPDLLIVSFFLNDINLPPDLFVFPEGILKRRERNSWTQHSALVKLVLSFFDRIEIEKEFIINAQNVYQSNHPAFIKMVAELDRIAAISKSENCDRILMLFPWLFHLDDGRYPFIHCHDLVRNHATSLDFKVVDLLSTYSGFENEELWVHPIDHHPNALAHQLASDTLISKVQELILSDLKVKEKMKERRIKQIVDQALLNQRTDWYVPFRTEPTFSNQ